jgi:hypothetical protein
VDIGDHATAAFTEAVAEPGVAARVLRGEHLANNGEHPMAQRKKSTNRREEAPAAENPKANPDPASNQIKDPDDWVTGHEPMTGAQASYLKTLSEQAREPDAYDPELDKAEASKRIDQLKEETGR